MRVGFSRGYNQALLLSVLLVLLVSGCRRNTEELPLVPPQTHPLSRDFIGFGVLNDSFVHLLDEPGPGGVSQAYLRRGTVVRIVERRPIVIRGITETWVLAEGNYQGPGSPSRGWVQEASVEIFDSESRAETASRAMSQ